PTLLLCHPAYLHCFPTRRSSDLDTGYPRVDLMYKADKDKLRQQLGVFTAKKIVLYAPTWRGELGKEKNESQKILEDVKNIQANIDEGVVLLKAHYYTEKFFKEQGLWHFLVPNTFDTNEVLSIVDVLITDYSSIFFEFLPTERPVIFYAYDEEEYQAKRGTYLQVDRKSTRLNSSHVSISYAVFCLKK